MGEVTERVRGVVAKDAGVMDTFGFSVERASEGVCEIACRVPQRFINAAGFAHGTIAFTMLDTACAYALASREVRGVTVNANMTYIKAADADAQLLARVHVVSQSRRVASLRGDLFKLQGGNGGGQEEVLLAHGSFVFQLIEVENW